MPTTIKNNDNVPYARETETRYAWRKNVCFSTENCKNNNNNNNNHNKTKQNKTKQNKTKQKKAKQTKNKRKQRARSIAEYVTRVTVLEKFSIVSKVIRVCFGLALLMSVIG